MTAEDIQWLQETNLHDPKSHIAAIKITTHINNYLRIQLYIHFPSTELKLPGILKSHRITKISHTALIREKRYLSTACYRGRVSADRTARTDYSWIA